MRRKIKDIVSVAYSVFRMAIYKMIKIHLKLL